MIFEKLLLEISGSVLRFSFFNSISNFYLNDNRDYLTLPYFKSLYLDDNYT